MLQTRSVPLYEREDGSIGILVSPGYGAGWSSWNETELAYDKRVIDFWLSHKDDQDFMRTVKNDGTKAHLETEKFFNSIGYDPYLGGFAQIELVFVPRGTPWRITEYDGSEGLETLDNAGFITF